ncbi:hypothetical protein HanXRQr2_Chr02g0055731 [Helianthus annuus]|uniref:Uncharacterized protein n=1 Tax=Helianthus annuus TaxID=4232 RepID=A0A9K3JM40_HELAN|nr:hypothetical protein HanXRQr2_Chr02g0055731 [Helianthus annuus]
MMIGLRNQRNTRVAVLEDMMSFIEVIMSDLSLGLQTNRTNTNKTNNGCVDTMLHAMQCSFDEQDFVCVRLLRKYICVHEQLPNEI